MTLSVWTADALDFPRDVWGEGLPHTRFFFDPGGECAGWAAFRGDRLATCGLSRTQHKHTFLRARAHRALLEYVGAYRSRGVLSEAMWFRQGKNKGDPQDLIDVNLIAGHVGTSWIHPQAWKGMEPKETHQPKILACLTPEELALVESIMPLSLRHNAIDAVGIGLHAVGRMEISTCPSRPPKLPTKRGTKVGKKRSVSPGSRSRRGVTSRPAKEKRGKRRPTPPSFITFAMPTKPDLTAPAR